MNSSEEPVGQQNGFAGLVNETMSEVMKQ